MSLPGPDDPTVSASSQPEPELAGLDPKDLLNAGLETVPPVTLPPQPVDPDATVRVQSPRPTQPAAPQVELPLPEELTQLLPPGAYKVESFLGQGGMGAVYKGMQIRLKRPVAIKIMRRDLGKDHDFEARFEREAQAMAKLNHPNIVSVIDYGEAGPDYLYIVMELIDGADLMDVIRGGQMTQEMALTLLPQICDALQFAHDHGIVHRDIKPSNIMLTRDGRIKMADFGLAKHFDAESSFRTQTGTGMGTPDYAAPEQFSPNSPIDHRADIYALGVMIYQMITGQLPRGVWKPPSQRAEVAPQWDSIVSRAMQSDPCDRYQQASEVKTDVSSIPLTQGRAAGPSAAASGPQAALGGPSALPRSKSRAPLLFGLITGVVVIAVGAFFALRDRDTGRAAAPPAAANGPEHTAREKGPATPNAAIAGASALPIASPALPESGWKPFFTEKEWRDTVPDNREFKDGLVHMPAAGFRKPLPSPDGAVRARLVIREDTKTTGVVPRSSKTEGRYLMEITSDRKRVVINYIAPQSKTNFTQLASYTLPRELRPGDTVLLEIRAQGDHLTGLVDGKLVLETRDDRVKTGEEWGISSVGGWFESVEVQPLPSAATPAPIAATTLPESGWQPLFSEKEWQNGDRGPSPGVIREYKEGLIHIRNWAMTKPQSSPDGAIRMRAVVRESSQTPAIVVRRSAGGSFYKFGITGDSKSIHLAYFKTGGASTYWLGSHDLPKPLQNGGKVQLELRVQGSQLTGLLNGAVVIQAEDEQIKTAGHWGIDAVDGWFESVEVQPLPATAAPSPIAIRPSIEVQAIKLWDTPEKVPSPVARWENGGVVIPNEGGITAKEVNSRNGVLRASVRMNPDAKKQSISLRWSEQGVEVNRGYYRLSVQSGRIIALDSVTDNRSTRIAEKPLPRSYASDEWLRLELKAEEDRLTASVDGTPLFTQSDSSIKGPGAVMIYGANCSFRDITYQPLDKAGSGSPPPPKEQSPQSTADAKTFGGHRYQFFAGRVNWAQARVQAESVGGHLATVTSAEEQAWIAANYGSQITDAFSYFWIGGVADSKTSAWRWVTNEPFAYKNWDRGKPAYLASNGTPLAAPFAIAFIRGANGFAWTDGSTAWTGTAGYVVEWDAPAEPWRNVLTDPTKLALDREVERKPEGLRFFGAGSVYLRTSKSTERDGAIRARTTFGGLRVQLQARRMDNVGMYQLYVETEKIIRLSRWESATAKTVNLRDFTLRKPLEAGQEYDLELRVVGQTLTAKYNGEVLGSVNDGTHTQGHFRIGTADRDGSPAMVKSLEVLDLDAAGKVSKLSDPKFPPGQWVKLFTKPEDLPADLRKPDSGVTWEDGWIKGDGRKVFPMIKVASNVGVRTRLVRRVTGGEAKGGGVSGITLRNGPSQRYQLKLLDDRVLALRFEGQQTATGDTVLESSLGSPLLPGQEITLEFAAVGQRLIARAGDSVFKVADRADVTSGAVYISGTDDIRDIEVINLDGLPEAEALRLLGVDEQGNDLRGKAGK